MNSSVPQSARLLSVGRQGLPRGQPSEGPFDFTAAYANFDNSPARALSVGRRLWRIFDLLAPSLHLDQRLGYAQRPTYPFSVTPGHRLPRGCVACLLFAVGFCRGRQLAVNPAGGRTTAFVLVWERWECADKFSAPFSGTARFERIQFFVTFPFAQRALK